VESLPRCSRACPLYLLARWGVIGYIRQAGGAMKLAFGTVLFFWLLCGVIGAWMLDDLDADHWKTIARGPITLGKALNEHPVTYAD
jgi:hypothetical protein